MLGINVVLATFPSLRSLLHASIKYLVKRAALEGVAVSDITKKIFSNETDKIWLETLLHPLIREQAISETMAVTMLIGNSNKVPQSIFSPANTLSSVIANEFAEASEALYLSSLVQLALVLFFVTSITGIVGRLIIKKWVTQ